MTERAGANLGLGSGWPPGYNGWGAIDNANLRQLDASIWFITRVAPLNAPPGSPALGDRYIVGTAPTGAWASYANCLAVWTEDETDTQLWNFFEPKDGWEAVLMPTDVSQPTVNYQWRNAQWNIVNLSEGSLAGLSDVAVTPGGGIDGYLFSYSVATGKWIAVAPPTVMGGSGALHKAGLVPDQPTVAGSSKFLREDKQWAAPFFGVTPLTIDFGGASVMSGAGTLNFTGSGVSVAQDTLDANTLNITIPGGTGGGGIAVYEGSSSINGAATRLTFGQYITAAQDTINAGNVNVEVNGLPGVRDSFLVGTLTAGQVIWAIKLTEAYNWPLDLDGSYIESNFTTASTAQTLTLAIGGAIRFTAEVSVGGAAATVTGSAFTNAVGDWAVYKAVTGDATFGDLSTDLLAYRD
jgi:hypothetical protein